MREEVRRAGQGRALGKVGGIRQRPQNGRCVTEFWLVCMRLACRSSLSVSVLAGQGEEGGDARRGAHAPGVEALNA